VGLETLPTSPLLTVTWPAGGPRRCGDHFRGPSAQLSAARMSSSVADERGNELLHVIPSLVLQILGHRLGAGDIRR
jgi:hypothetical protein